MNKRNKYEQIFEHYCTIGAMKFDKIVGMVMVYKDFQRFVAMLPKDFQLIQPLSPEFELLVRDLVSQGYFKEDDLAVRILPISANTRRYMVDAVLVTQVLEEDDVERIELIVAEAVPPPLFDWEVGTQRGRSPRRREPMNREPTPHYFTLVEKRRFYQF